MVGSIRLGSLACLVFLCISCGRKDVDRQGRIKLRGESTVSLEGKREGALLQTGAASWYGRPYHGRRTANGEIYDMRKMTAAHKTLPFGSIVRVVNKQNGKSVQVRINDRGPFIRGRIIDLSREAARRLDMELAGVSEVALYLAEPAGRSITRESVREKGFWTIQVGSFGDREKARALAAKMRTYSEEVSIERADSMYRVRIGRFRTKSEAGSLAETLYDADIPVWIVFSDKN